MGENNNITQKLLEERKKKYLEYTYSEVCT